MPLRKENSSLKMHILALEKKRVKNLQISCEIGQTKFLKLTLFERDIGNSQAS